MRQAIVVGTLLVPIVPVMAAVEDGLDTTEIIVTATRTAETAEETLASVSVITREDIERRQVRSVADALRGLPGLALSNSGGAGKATSVNLRGTNANHVLVLIDGVKVGSATLGATAFQFLPIDEVERIEVVRGPRSSLYGSEAIGGVIQLFTRKGGGALRPRFSVGAGSYETASVSGGLSGGGENGWFDVSLSLEDTEGFNACNGDAATFAGCYVDEPDADGFHSDSASLRLGYRFGALAEAELHWLRSDTESEYDGSPFGGNASKDLQQVLGARVILTPMTPWMMTIAGGRSWDESRTNYGESPTGNFETRRDTFSWQNDIELGASHLVTLGLDYQHDEVDGSPDYTEDSRDNTGVFGQYLGTFGANEIQLSLRHDDNEQFGDYTTGNAAWGYRFANGLSLMASYGTAFKAPTFNDLYYPEDPVYGGGGNPDLDPEASQSVEVGLSGKLMTVDWSVNLYQTEIDDLIDGWPPENVDSARIRGLDASAASRLANWSVAATLTLLDHENRSAGPNEGNLLRRRPEQTFNLDLQRAIGPLSLGGSLFVAGRSFDDAANTERLDAYSLLGLRAEYALSPRLRLQGRVENLLDEDYETIEWYNQSGRAYYITLRYGGAASR